MNFGYHRPKSKIYPLLCRLTSTSPYLSPKPATFVSSTRSPGSTFSSNRTISPILNPLFLKFISKPRCPRFYNHEWSRPEKCSRKPQILFLFNRFICFESILSLHLLLELLLLVCCRTKRPSYDSTQSLQVSSKFESKCTCLLLKLLELLGTFFSVSVWVSQNRVYTL
jgi:hypothetical protein